MMARLMFDQANPLTQRALRALATAPAPLTVEALAEQLTDAAPRRWVRTEWIDRHLVAAERQAKDLGCSWPVHRAGDELRWCGDEQWLWLAAG